MDKFCNDFEFFINQRMETNLKKLNENEYYQKSISEFCKLEENLSNKLAKDDKIILENLIEYLYNMHTEQNFCAYKLGLNDGIYFKNYLNN